MSSPQKTKTKHRSWQTINKERKEQKRKWKEENLEKKLKKQKQLEEAKENGETIPKENSVKIANHTTVSIAVPGSILENCQSQELRAFLCARIARAACIYHVDEVVVFDDYCDEANAKKVTINDSYSTKTIRECCAHLCRILQYLECPQYLRKYFFRMHYHLKYCGLLTPLSAPHHLDKTDEFPFREGVVLNKPVKAGKGSMVNVGLLQDVQVDKLLVAGIRCTVRLAAKKEGSKKMRGQLVSPYTPCIEVGAYWGYTVRLATSLSKVFTECPFKEGYDVTIGTSDKGSSIDEFECPSFKHLLITFGGIHGLEAALECDTELSVDDPKDLFQYYLNTSPEQGTRTIRTEEAILISLAALRPKLKSAKKNDQLQ